MSDKSINLNLVSDNRLTNLNSSNNYNINSSNNNNINSSNNNNITLNNNYNINTISNSAINSNNKSYLISNNYQINKKEKKKLSGSFKIEVNIPNKNIKLKAEILELLNETKFPEISYHINDFSHETLVSLLEDYFSKIEENTNIILNDYGVIIKTNKYINEMENPAKYNEYDNFGYEFNILSFICKVKDLRNTHKKNVCYKIKLLAIEEIFADETKKRNKRNNFLFIIHLRINYDLNSYIFLLKNADTSFENIDSFFYYNIISNKDKSDNSAYYIAEKIKIMVLFEDPSNKITIKYPEKRAIYCKEIKIIEELKENNFNLSSVQFYESKEFKIEKENLYVIIENLQKFQKDFQHNVSIYILIEKSEIEIESEARKYKFIIVLRVDYLLYKFIFEFSLPIPDFILFLELFENNNIIYFFSKLIQNKHYQINIDCYSDSSGNYLESMKIFESLKEQNFIIDSVSFDESKTFNLRSNRDLEELKKIILDLYIYQNKVDCKNFDYILNKPKYESKFYIFIRYNGKLFAYEFRFENSYFFEEIKKFYDCY